MIQDNDIDFNSATHQSTVPSTTPTRFRAPLDIDASRVWSLIEATPALDDNSLYANLLQCSDFAATCALAERGDELLGWMSGYVPPSRPDTLFVWQICVSDAARGLGMGRRLLAEALSRPANAHIHQLACTITADNTASWALFASVARALDAPLQRVERFDTVAHFAGAHASEFGVTIGPFHRDRAATLAAD